jgi:hypothetical protein
MIKNTPKLQKFYRKLIENENIPYEKAVAIYEAMLHEARSLGVVSSENILEGIDIDIKIARAINGLPK